MYHIQTFDHIASAGLEKFPRDRYEVAGSINNPNGIVVRSTKLHDLELNENLSGIARAGVGIDNIPVDRCTDAGIAVFNTPGANAGAVCELIIAAVLMTSRRLFQGVQFCQELQGQADEVVKAAEKAKKQFGGQEASGRVLGVVGLGAIGARVASAAMGMGMKVIGYDPWLSVENALKLPSGFERTEFLQELFAKSDYITLHIPLFEKTKNLINSDSLQTCKKGVRILNFSRDGIVNNEAILKSIEEDHVAFYATDFTRPELLGNERVLCFPHLGASTAEAEENCAVMASEQLIEFLEHGNVINSVNYPAVQVPRTTDYRLTVYTRNIPNMVGQISTTLGNHKINISELVNKSRGDVAYNIIDLDAECPEAVFQALKSVEGVIAVRSLCV